jgi:hypothetical protein
MYLVVDELIPRMDAVPFDEQSKADERHLARGPLP